MGASIPGSRHARSGKPNQDAIALGELPKMGGTFAAISDGHGSRTCFRSGKGAHLAVSIAEKVLHTDRIADYLKERHGMRLIAEEILHLWRSSVMEHLKQHPFIPDETEELDRQQRTLLGRNALVAYGATLLVAYVLESDVYFLQLGDGDFLTLDSAGAVNGVFKPDGKHMGNATTSLCMPNALDEFRFCHLHSGPLKMLLGSTDGYGNSFRSEADFHKTLRDFSRLISVHGFDAVHGKLPEWLKETSEQGSGDDISVALIFR